MLINTLCLPFSFFNNIVDILGTKYLATLSFEVVDGKKARKFSSRGTGGLNRHPVNESVPISYVIYHMSYAIGSKRGWGAMGGAWVLGEG